MPGGRSKKKVTHPASTTKEASSASPATTDAGKKTQEQESSKQKVEPRAAKSTTSCTTIHRPSIPSGFPPAELNIKVGVPVMLLRNLNPAKGMVNGAILVVRETHNHIILGQKPPEPGGFWQFEAKNEMLIPRLPAWRGGMPRDRREVRRVQFPIKLAFAQLLHRSQGRTLVKAGFAASVEMGRNKK